MSKSRRKIAPDRKEVSWQLLRLINAVRSRHKLRCLKWDEGLYPQVVRTCRQTAKDTDTLLRGKVEDEKKFGTIELAKAIMRGWESKNHMRNMLNNSAAYAAIAVIVHEQEIFSSALFNHMKHIDSDCADSKPSGEYEHSSETAISMNIPIVRRGNAYRQQSCSTTEKRISVVSGHETNTTQFQSNVLTELKKSSSSTSIGCADSQCSSKSSRKKSRHHETSNSDHVKPKPISRHYHSGKLGSVPVSEGKGKQRRERRTVRKGSSIICMVEKSSSRPSGMNGKGFSQHRNGQWNATATTTTTVIASQNFTSCIPRGQAIDETQRKKRMLYGDMFNSSQERRRYSFNVCNTGQASITGEQKAGEGENNRVLGRLIQVAAQKLGLAKSPSGHIEYPTRPGKNFPNIAKDIMKIVNKNRVKRELFRVAWDDGLMKLAEDHSKLIHNRQEAIHSRHWKDKYPENVTFIKLEKVGDEGIAEALYLAFERRRINMMNTSFKFCSVAVYGDSKTVAATMYFSKHRHR